jgi:hypothetical protein
MRKAGQGECASIFRTRGGDLMMCSKRNARFFGVRWEEEECGGLYDGLDI